MSRVNWARIDEATFNDLAESLLVREFTGDGLVAMAIDGRGGDGGIDVDVRSTRTNQLVHIFQLKYFPEGFSGGHVKRREQIKKSMRKAIETEHPPVWSLVVPRKVTAQERKAVRAMRGGVDMIIRFMSPVELELLLAKHPDIEERFTVDRAVELLKAVHRPEAALTKPGDLHDELRRIEGRLKGRSEYWGTAFSLGPDGTYVETIYAKRADAPEREPLGLTLTTAFTPDDLELQTRFESAMRFGSIDPIILPANVIDSFRTTGPEWYAEEQRDLAEIEIRPTDEPHDSVAVRVDVRDDGGKILAKLSGRTTARAAGYAGVTLSTLFEGGLAARWTLPRDVSESGSVTFETNFVGSTAHEIRRALRFRSETEAGATIGLTIDELAPILMNLTDIPPTSGPDPFAAFIDDLCFLENYFDVSLRLPTDVDSSDLIWARVLRLLANGEATVNPFMGTFGATLDGSRDEGLETLLGSGAAIVARSSRFTIELFGEELSLEDIAYYAHRARIDDPEEIYSALDDGTAAGMHVAIRPVDGLPWVIYSPSLLEAAGHSVVITKPWSIEGLDEHPGYGRLPNREGNQ